MAKARAIPGFEDAPSFREAAALAVETRAEEVFEFRSGILDTADIERVHDMRVATRRLRAVMEIFSDCFPRKPYRRALRDVKKLADALGERRDRDVAIAALERVAEGLTGEDRRGIRSLVDELRAEQEVANRQLEEELEALERDELETRLRALAGSARVG